MTAWLFAEAAPPLAERDYQVLRTHSGLAPVTKQSGKRRLVVMRRGCNPRLRHALYHMARVAMQRAAHFSRVYAALRARGQRHGARPYALLATDCYASWWPCCVIARAMMRAEFVVSRSCKWGKNVTNRG